jgi:uncharacterized OB-fold protein
LPNIRSVVDPIPLVDYLMLDDGPYLIANECTLCGARYFDRRSGCANCGGQEFRTVRIADTGTLRTFTIVHFAAEGVEVPFVAGIVDCDGTSVRSNIVNVSPDPQHLRMGMKVRLTTVPVGVDESGVQALGFGFEPAE